MKAPVLLIAVLLVTVGMAGCSGSKSSPSKSPSKSNSPSPTGSGGMSCATMPDMPECKNQRDPNITHTDLGVKEITFPTPNSPANTASITVSTDAKYLIVKWWVNWTGAGGTTAGPGQP